MENFSLVQQYLGGQSAIGVPHSELDFVPMIREGFPISVFAALRTHTNLSEEAIFESLGIAKRTGARRKRDGTRLKPNESELVLRLARVLAAGTDVLGDEDKARSWLMSENRALGGKAPITLLDTGIGFEEVMDALRRIEYGVFS